MMRKCLVCLLVVLLLITLPSCKKKDGNDEAGASTVSPAVETVVSGTAGKIDSPSKESEVSVEPVKEVVAEEKSDALSFVDMTEIVVDDSAREEFYRGGKFFIRGYFDKESGELVFENTEDDEILSILDSFVTLNPDANDMTFELENGTVTLKYSLMSGSERDEWWKLFVIFMNDYNASLEKTVVVPKSVETVKGTLNAEIYPDKTVLTLPSDMSEDELYEFAQHLVESYPELLTSFSFENDGESVTLYYLEGADNGLASAYFNYLGSEIDSYFAPSTVEETVVAEEVTPSAEETEEVKVEEPAQEKKDVAPQTEVGKSVKKFSASLSLFNSLDTSESLHYAWAVYAGFDYAVLPSLKVGAATGYNYAGYIPLFATVRYYAPFIDGLYFGGKAGALIGVGDNCGVFGCIAGLNVGYEYEFNNGLAAFIEADADYIRFDNNHFRFGVTVGGRYRF